MPDKRIKVRVSELKATSSVVTNRFGYPVKNRPYSGEAGHIYCQAYAGTVAANPDEASQITLAASIISSVHNVRSLPNQDCS